MTAAPPGSPSPAAVPGWQFASDNASGFCPEAWARLERADAGCVPSYGGDAWTDRARELIRDVFEHDAEVFFVFNGTAANSLALSALCRSYHAVLCHRSSHVETDECGAPEFFSGGAKVVLLEGERGKIGPDAIDAAVARGREVHFPKVRAVSVTQATEVSSVYAVDELAAIGAACARHGLRLHMDGARFANAVAALGVPPRAITRDVGVDVLCFGGTKNGMGIGEAVVFFDRALAEEFAWRVKQAGQLASKMRYLAAPWVGLLEDGAWLRNAARANAAAARLEAGLAAVPGIALACRREANAVFVRLPPRAVADLHARGWHFYEFPDVGAHRLMCSWATTDAEIDALLADVRAAVHGAAVRGTAGTSTTG